MDYGTDINSNGQLNSKGQVSLVSGKDNVIQSYRNRINTFIGTYFYIDPDYGSMLKEYIGFDNNFINQSLACLELENQALKDPRIISAKAEYKDKSYYIKLELSNGEEEILEGLI